MSGKPSKARTLQLEAQILDVLEHDHPVSVRHLFYRMTNPSLPEYVTKDDLGYDVIQRLVLKMRRDGKVPYSHIVDGTRAGVLAGTFLGRGDFLRRIAWNFRSDPWIDTDYFYQVWVESRSVAGMIAGIADEHCVDLYACAGFSSATLAHDGAQRIRRLSMGRPVIIGYIGDYDPAGVLIDQAVERELRQHLGNYAPLQFDRLAITEDQIAEMALPTKPRRDSDRRAAHIEATVEAEAMPIATMRGILTDHILQFLPLGALAEAKAADALVVAKMKGIADGWDEEDAFNDHPYGGGSRT